jgi:hypothetical protein
MSAGPAEPLDTSELLEELVAFQERLLEILNQAYDYLHEADGIDFVWIATRINRDPAWVQARMTGQQLVTMNDMVLLAAALDCVWDFSLRLGRAVDCDCEECLARRERCVGMVELHRAAPLGSA